MNTTPSSPSLPYKLTLELFFNISILSISFGLIFSTGLIIPFFNGTPLITYNGFFPPLFTIAFLVPTTGTTSTGAGDGGIGGESGAGIVEFGWSAANLVCIKITPLLPAAAP